MRSSRVTIVSLILIVSCVTLYIVLWLVANPFAPNSDLLREAWEAPYSPANHSNPARYRYFTKRHKHYPINAEPKRIPVPVPDDMVTEFDLNATAIAIDALESKWQKTFFDIFIPHEFRSLFPDSNATVLPRNDDVLSTLLRETHIFFASSSDITKSKQFILMKHRSMISMRRYLMILCETFLSHKIDFNRTLYQSLIQDVFVPIRVKYATILQNEFAKPWFLIHISKSAGSTVCATQKYVGYQQLLYGGTNCNIEFHAAPIKNEDGGIFSCDDIEAIRQSGDTEFMASERPITGHMTSNKPTLCDTFQYILPVRHPLSRVASTINEYRLDKLYFPFEILIKQSKDFNVSSRVRMQRKKRSKLRQIAGDQLSSKRRYRHVRKLTALLKLGDMTRGGLRTGYCLEKFVKLGGRYYAPLWKKEDFSDFVSHLFANEKETDDKGETLWQNNFHCKHKTTLDNEEQKLYQYDDMTYVTYLGDDKKYAIKTTEGFKHRSNVSLLRGYSSNINTRWIGYQRKDGTDASYDAIFEKSYNINVTHWLNAVEFMMRTDYVMPFETQFTHEIFKFTLKDLWDFVPNYIHKRSAESRRRLARLLRKRPTIHRHFKKSKRVTKKRKEVNAAGNDYYDDESTQAGSVWKKRFTTGTRGRGRRGPDRIRFRRHSVRRRYQKPASRTEWAHSHVASDNKYHVSTQSIMSGWTFQEKQFILKKNTLDVHLYKMATWIAEVDVMFYNRVNAYQNK